ncbi:11154_t:CDS:2 [Gigaspora margarita]|uniref:11154_t:CDS:1 n=1 Tax=Gigaspora margarita TaxID=4874 RepID=A0ABN7UD60_GIGMA|nr:11154_t:CDS:2 [Gigaspora margarita]
MNSQIEILKKRKLIKQHDLPKKKPKISIESKMIESANKVKNVHFLTLVLNYVNNPFTFFFVSLKNLCDSLEFDPPNPRSRKYKTYYSIFLKNVHQLCTSCWQDFGSKQTSISKINFKLDNFYEPTPIFKTRTNYDFCEYLVDELEPLVDYSVVEGAEIKLCSNCTIKKKEFLFNSIYQLKDSIYIKLKEVKYTKFFYKDVIRIVFRNLYKILKEDYLYIEKYGVVVKNYDFPKNL